MAEPKVDFARGWYVAGLIGGVVLTLLAHVFPVESEAFPQIGSVFDVAHVLGFALVTLLACFAMRRVRPHLRWGALPAYVGVALFVLALAVLSEAAQYPTSRDADFADLLRDIAGWSAGLLFSFAFEARAAARLMAVLVGAVCLVAGTLQPMTILAGTTYARMNASAEIDFDGWLDRFLVDAESAKIALVAAPKHWDGAIHVLRVTTSRRRQRVRIMGLVPDWSRFDALKFTIASEDPGLTAVQLRIYYSDGPEARTRRYRRRIEVGVTPREVVIPIAEIAQSADMSANEITNVHGVVLTVRHEPPTTFYVGGIRLSAGH